MKNYSICFAFFVSCALNAQDYRTIPQNKFQTTLIKPLEIKEVDKNHFFIDFGRAFFGTVQLTSKLYQKDSLVLHFGEKSMSEARVDRDPGGSIRYQKVVLDGIPSDKSILIQLPANKRNTTLPAIQLPDSFGVVMPFRYLEIENLKIPLDSIEIFQKGFYYKFNDNASYFKSSDTVLDSVWDLCKHTIKATSFTGFYVDGDRERIPYEADAYINQLSHYSLDSVYDIGKRTNLYFLENPTWPTEWLLHTVLLFYHDFMYTGDLKMLSDNYEALKLKTLIDLEREDGLISSRSKKMDSNLIKRLGFKKPDTQIKDIVDWPPGQKDTGWKLKNEAGERDGYEMVPINTVVNSFYYRNLVLMSASAGHLNKVDDVLFWKEKAAKVKSTINKKLFNKERGVYVDGEGSEHASLHANMFPLVFGLVPKENEGSVIKFIKSRGMACSVYGAQHLLDGLYASGEAKYAQELITDTISDRSWWNMIKIGATMTLEAWDAGYKPNLDWNHAWGTAPANIIVRRIWGITPKTPGFAIATIKPQLGDLTFSEIKVPTKNGVIYATFELRGKIKSFDIQIPDNMTAEFILGKDENVIKFNGSTPERNNGVLVLSSGSNRIEVAP